MRKTKIICTLGPATDQPGVLKQVALAGMDVARFNFSHGSYEEHGERFKLLCQVREEVGRPIAALLDTKGPEIRLRDFANGKEYLEKGQTFTLTTREVKGTKDIVSISYSGLPKDVKIGTRVLIDDGLIEMVVEEKTETDIVCKVLNEGPVSNKKGVNVPDTRLSMPYLSEKDKEDIIFAVKMGYDFIAASFVRSAADVFEVRKILSENDNNTIRIISKIENKEGVDNIDEIIEASYGIMVARGDLGIEVPIEKIPGIQRRIIAKCVKASKPVIVATQMLHTMIKNPRPTRAEVTDIANAIFYRTDALMLSGETASGKYPVEAVQTMARIAEQAEKDKSPLNDIDPMEDGRITQKLFLAHAAIEATKQLGVKGIITDGETGETARDLAAFRGPNPVLAICYKEKLQRWLNLSYGIIPIYQKDQVSTKAMFTAAVRMLRQKGYLQEEDKIAYLSGSFGEGGGTTFVEINKVKKIFDNSYTFNLPSNGVDDNK